MNCPVCTDTTLVMADKQGIEIDYCPKCRGVWLDRGELDKIVERSMGNVSTSQSRPAVPHDPEPRRPPKFDREYERDHERGYGRDEYPRKKKKKGFLGELFDFD